MSNRHRGKTGEFPVAVANLARRGASVGSTTGLPRLDAVAD